MTSVPDTAHYDTGTGPGTDDPSAKEKVAQSTEAGKQAASDVASTAAGHAQEVAGEAKTQAANLVNEATGQLRAHAAEQHRNAANSVRSLGDELRTMADRSENDGVATDLVGRAADHAHRVAGWLDDREPGDLVQELRQFATRRPGAFLLGALAAGVVAGRLTRGAIAVHTDDGDGPSSGGASNVAAPRHETSVPATPAPTPPVPATPTATHPASGPDLTGARTPTSAPPSATGYSSPLGAPPAAGGLRPGGVE